MGKSITFEQFENGLDLRKGRSTSDANRLLVLKNAHVTEGKTIRKRPGLTKVATLEAGTEGLKAGLGVLHTFNTSGVTHANALFQSNDVSYSAQSITDVHYADTFNGFMYAVIEYANGDVRHHYLDGSGLITDVNCPQTKQAIKIASKIFAVGTNGDTVRYSATNAPADWTTANDAGFLPVGLQQAGSNESKALGYYSNRLVVFFSDSSQIWQVDVDPANNQFLQMVDVGTTLPYAHENMRGDVLFLSPNGVRSIARQDDTNNLIDFDIGSPIDRELIKNTYIDITQARAQYYRGGGQFWLYQGTKAVVYTFSRTAKISAWSVYEFPFNLDYVEELNAELYIRSGDDVYKVDRTVNTDDGALYSVDIELPFLDFKSPGVLKQIYSMDAVVSGQCDISHRFDPRSPELITNPPVTIEGDTRPGYLYPVELATTNLSPVINNYDDQEFELHQLTYYFDVLGNM